MTMYGGGYVSCPERRRVYPIILIILKELFSSIKVYKDFRKGKHFSKIYHKSRKWKRIKHNSDQLNWGQNVQKHQNPDPKNFCVQWSQKSLKSTSGVDKTEPPQI